MSKAYREWKRHEKELREAFNAAHIPITLAEYKKQRRRISKARKLEIKRFRCMKSMAIRIRCAILIPSGQYICSYEVHNNRKE